MQYKVKIQLQNPEFRKQEKSYESVMENWGTLGG